MTNENFVIKPKFNDTLEKIIRYAQNKWNIKSQISGNFNDENVYIEIYMSPASGLLFENGIFIDGFSRWNERSISSISGISIREYLIENGYNLEYEI